MNGYIGPPSHCYVCAGWGWIFGDIGVDLSPSDVVMTWLRLNPLWTASHIQIGCFTTMICYEWVYWSILTLLCLYKIGVDFWRYWGRPEPEWWCNVMVEAQTPHGVHSASILDVKKCFSTLICYEWAYGSTLTLLCLCRFGVDFWGYWGSLSLSDIVMSWLRLNPPMECIPHPYWMYTKCFSTLI
jgi:hypothetical protein